MCNLDELDFFSLVVMRLCICFTLKSIQMILEFYFYTIKFFLKKMENSFLTVTYLFFSKDNCFSILLQEQ